MEENTPTQLLASLAKLLPADRILSHESELKPFECDGLTAYRRIPLLAVIPTSQDEVRAIIKSCANHKVPIVTRGAGTGLSGGATPLENGVLLVMTKLNRILNIDPQNHQATVEPGVTNLAISQAAASHGLYYAPDPSSQIVCSIGGNVAENSGGVHCLKYGLTVHNIHRIKILTIDGEEIEIGSYAYDTPGYDLLALMTGSEGMLGIMTEITVKLIPRPKSSRVILSSFNHIAEASDTVVDIISSGITPAGLEMLDNQAIRAVEAFTHSGYPVSADAILICELDGSTTDVKEQVEKTRHLMQKHKAATIHVAASEEEGQKLWAGRKAAFPAVGRLTPDYYCMDGTIPRRRLAEVLTNISTLAKKYHLAVANVFHAGDGNLHPLIMYDANQPRELEKAEAFGKEILELSIAAGGTITGEHGVGIEKLDSMCSQFSAAEIDQFHRLKASFDPKSLLNPGKAIPTLNRCAELGAMHVHKGKLPHPDLPRF